MHVMKKNQLHDFFFQSMHGKRRKLQLLRHTKKQFHINQMQITKLFHAKLHNSCINEYSLRL